MKRRRHAPSQDDGSDGEDEEWFDTSEEEDASSPEPPIRSRKRGKAHKPALKPRLLAPGRGVTKGPSRRRSKRLASVATAQDDQGASPATSGANGGTSRGARAPAKPSFATAT
jgi:hypothetical protein